MNASVKLSTIIVKSMEESVGFYSGIMGLEIDSEYDLGAMGRITLMRGSGSAMVELIESPSYPVGFWSVGFYVDDMETAMAEYREKGAKILAEPVAITGGSCAFIEDPNGVRLAIVKHDKGRESDDAGCCSEKITLNKGIGVDSNESCS